MNVAGSFDFVGLEAVEPALEPRSLVVVAAAPESTAKAVAAANGPVKAGQEQNAAVVALELATVVEEQNDLALEGAVQQSECSTVLGD